MNENLWEREEDLRLLFDEDEDEVDDSDCQVLHVCRDPDCPCCLKGMSGSIE